ncbi:MAG: TolC family outer membrane protein [Burkholderiaceae bacterium]|nr:TolC family outer membrane protein [Burkholderiaceae bacterium]
MGSTLRRLAAALPFAVACAQPAHSTDLRQAFHDALANDAALQSVRAQLAATRERVTQARSGMLPGVSAAGSLNRQMVDTNVSASREFNAQSYSINLSYPIYRLQNIEAYEQSKLSVVLIEAQEAQAQQDLILRVAQAYFDVLAAQDNVATIRSQKRAITEQLASAKRNFEVGTATITDQQEAQARFDLSVAQEFVALNDMEVKRAALAQLTGKQVAELNTLRQGLTLQAPQPPRESDWTAGARDSSFGVRQAKLSAEIAAREIDRQRYAHRPTLDLTGSIGHSRNAGSSSVGVHSTATVIGLQFNMPLYTGGAIDARVREALALRDKAAFDLESARRLAEQGARQAFLGVNSGLAQVTALEAAEKSSQLALDSNLLGYQVGVRINIDVLNAQQQLFTTRRDLAKARYDVLVSGLRLKGLAGALGEDDLQAVNALLETPRAGTR